MQTATMPKKVHVIWGNLPGREHLKTGDETAPGVMVLRVEDLKLDIQHKLFEAMFCKKQAA